MDGSRPSSIEVAPLQSDGSLHGFMLIGRWPQDTVEWAKFLVLAVRMAAVPGLLPMSTVFRVREDLPEQPQPGAVGLVIAEGQLIGDHALASRPVRRPAAARSRRAAPAVQHLLVGPGLRGRLRLPASCPASRTSVSIIGPPGWRPTSRAP